MTDDLLVVYVTCGSLEEARRIGRAVVEDGLAACANITMHDTIYRWEGAIAEGSEARLLLKTTASCYPRLQARIAGLHSYTVPCIVAWPFTAALPAFAAWVSETCDGPPLSGGPAV